MTSHIYTRVTLAPHSRHPNFWAEQCLWWSFHLLSYAPAVAAGKTKWHPPHVNWTILGPVFLSLLFLASTDLTEKLSVAKYPKYKRYQKASLGVLIVYFYGSGCGYVCLYGWRA